MKTQLLALLSATALASAFGQTTPPNLTNGLVAFYPFEGNANNSIGNSNNATPAGNYQYLGTGLSGGAIRINGDFSLYYSGGGHIMLPNFGSNMNSAFTCSFWVKDESIGGWPVGEETYILLDNNPIASAFRAQIILQNQGQPRVLYALGNGSGVTAGDVIKPINMATYAPAWKHLAMVVAPGRFTCYFDGAKIGETNISFNIFPTAYAALGRHWWDSGSSARMSCTYDTVRIWNRGLTDQEVKQIFNYDQGISSIDIRVKTLRLTMNLELTKTYQIEASTNLPTWFNYGSTFVATNTPIYQDVDVDVGPQFFRLKKLP